MGASRLWNYPSETKEVLGAVISGSQSYEDIAEEIGCAKSTAENKAHDPRHLNLIRTEDGKILAEQEARRIIQLNDHSILEERFLDLPGTSKVIHQLEEEGSITFEEIGRIISFETGSGAAKPKTFQHYGRIYANWIDFLEHGEVYENDILFEPGKSPELTREEPSSTRLAPTPQLVVDALEVIENVTGPSNLAETMGISESFAEKVVTTSYSLKLIESARRSGYNRTDRGTQVVQASAGNIKTIFEQALLEVPIVASLGDEISNNPFNLKTAVERISEEYMLGWKDSTVEMVAGDLENWTTFTGLVEVKEDGKYIASETLMEAGLES